MKTHKDLPGWCNFHNLYDEAVARVPDGAILVEIGCWLGASSAYLYQLAKDSGKDLTLVFIDTWAGEPGQDAHAATVEAHGGDLYPAWRQNMIDCGADFEGTHPRIVTHQVLSTDGAALFPDGSLDFVFVDAAHDYDSVRADILAWLPKLKLTGHIAGHDYGWHEVKKAVDELLTVTVNGACWERYPAPGMIEVKKPLTCLGILGHSGAIDTVKDFARQWRTLGFPIIAFVPEGDEWPGVADLVVKHGASAHRGGQVFARFHGACVALLRLPFDHYVIMEYDTVNLVPHLPSGLDPQAVNVGLIKTITDHPQGPMHENFWDCKCDGPPHDPCGITLEPFNGFALAMSPWMMSRAMLAALVEAMEMHLRHPVAIDWIDGLLDRWISVCITMAGLRMRCIKGIMPWPAVHPVAPKVPPTWVHGRKRKSEFGSTWPPEQ